MDLGLEVASEGFCDDAQGQGRIARAFGSAEMRSENDLCAGGNEEIERRKRRTDTAVVGDLTVAVEGDVEISADEDALSGEFAVGQQVFK